MRLPLTGVLARLRQRLDRYGWRTRLTVLALTALAAFWLVTLLSLHMPPALDSLANPHATLITDRHGEVLHQTFDGSWNETSVVPLSQVPPLLQAAFIGAEDRRFYQHAGPDWQARVAALWQNLKAGRKVRGASTISEQVVRLLTPRPRTLWSRWLEGWEARWLEQREGKPRIFAFYLNQTPYASGRRGVQQAAALWFGRELATLNEKEQLALAVLVRAPSAFDLRNDPLKIEPAINRLADWLHATGVIDSGQRELITASKLSLHSAPPATETSHFLRALKATAPVSTTPATIQPDRLNARRVTTLDASLQREVQALLDARLDQLATRQVENAAALVVDHQSGEVLAWVVSGKAGAWYNAVAVPRQPGSTLKPFVYALALERGWTLATPIIDEPLRQAVGRGLHTYHNYSRRHYGAITVREALANSLNVPAVKTLQFVGSTDLLKRLRALGMSALTEQPAVYGDGLALGNGEVSLQQLVEGYATLARGGQHLPLRFLRQENLRSELDLALLPTDPAAPVFSAMTSQLIANVLADSNARALEFGAGNSLHFAGDVAVKTGTSNDYRDAWLLAFNQRYVIGVWMGNLSQRPMQEITGSTGPALVVHDILRRLAEDSESAPLMLSRQLLKRRVCVAAALKDACVQRDEWFVPGTEPETESAIATPDLAMIAVHSQEAAETRQTPTFRQPVEGLELALDPRIPDQFEQFRFELASTAASVPTKVRWWLDGELLAETGSPHYLWPLRKGRHRLHAEVPGENAVWRRLQAVSFVVK